MLFELSKEEVIVMGFIDDIPNYKTLNSKELLTNKLPREFWEGFHAYAVRASKNVDIKVIVNALNNIALLPPTGNWGYDYLLRDLDDTIFKIKQKAESGNYPLAMDAVSCIVQKGKLDLDEINDWLAQNKIAYYIFDDGLGNYYWDVRGKIDDITNELEDTSEMVKSVSQQALEHLEQAKIQLENIENERARKDAVRDCASAMEAVIKEYGKINDIGDATKALKDSGSWGKSDIVKDGNSIFNTLHRLYPDFRHGSTETSEMTKEEAIYWVDRIMAYIKYMIRKSKTFGAEEGDFDF